jgi:antitoxin Phd
MIVDTNRILTVTEANQNFSKAAKIAEKNGSAVIFKNNRPRYMLVDLTQNPVADLTDDEKIDVVAKRVLEKYRVAFEELAK